MVVRMMVRVAWIARIMVSIVIRVVVMWNW